MTQSDFPNSLDVMPGNFDGIDYVEAETLNPIIQGARACQTALEEKPYAPDSAYHGSLWNWGTVKAALQDLARIEVAEISVGIPVPAGYVDIPLLNPGRFNKTSTNGLGFIIVAQRLDADGDSAFLPDEYPNYPNHPVTQLNYDGSGNLIGFRLNWLVTSGDYSRIRFRYLAMEVAF